MQGTRPPEGSPKPSPNPNPSPNPDPNPNPNPNPNSNPNPNPNLCKASVAYRSLPAELAAYAQAGLKMRRMQQLPTVCAAECVAAGVRLNERGNALLLEGVEDDDGWFAPFDAALVRGARGALEAALRALPPPPRTNRSEASWAFLAHPPPPPQPRELEVEMSSPGYRAMLPLRARLPAHAMGRQIAEMVRSERVVLVLGATGCAGLATRTCTPRSVADVHPCARCVPCVPCVHACMPTERTLG